MSVPEISVDELAARRAAGDVQLFDVRQPDEYEAGHVPGAVLVPLGDVPDRTAEFPVGVPVHVICRSGARSRAACEHLVEHGVDAVNIAGGTLAWVESGRDVATGPSAA